MYNPNKYDNTNSPKNNKSKAGDFIEKRNKIIKFLNDVKPIILAECESMDKYIENNPEGSAVEPFTKKLDGWSRILNGTDILTEMYISNS